MKNLILKNALEFLREGKITEGIKLTEGWFSPERNNTIYIVHEKISNFFFNMAINRLPTNYRKKLLGKFNHKTHFKEGVSKSTAVEYYYLCSDAVEDNGKIKGLDGGKVSMTIEMRAYLHAIDETVIAIFDRPILLKEIILEVAKPLNQIFEGRTEYIMKKLHLSCFVKDDFHVLAPIPYQEYKLGQQVDEQVTVSILDDYIIDVEILGIKDKLKPLDDYFDEVESKIALQMLSKIRRKYDLIESDAFIINAIKDAIKNPVSTELLEKAASKYENIEEFRNDGDFEKVFSSIVNQYEGLNYAISLERLISSSEEVKTLLINKNR